MMDLLPTYAIRPAHGKAMLKPEAPNTTMAASGPNRTAAKIAGSSEIETVRWPRSVMEPRSAYAETNVSARTTPG